MLSLALLIALGPLKQVPNIVGCASLAPKSRAEFLPPGARAWVSVPSGRALPLVPKMSLKCLAGEVKILVYGDAFRLRPNHQDFEIKAPVAPWRPDSWLNNLRAAGTPMGDYPKLNRPIDDSIVRAEKVKLVWDPEKLSGDLTLTVRQGATLGSVESIKNIGSYRGSALTELLRKARPSDLTITLSSPSSDGKLAVYEAVVRPMDQAEQLTFTRELYRLANLPPEQRIPKKIELLRKYDLRDELEDAIVELLEYKLKAAEAGGRNQKKPGRSSKKSPNSG